MPRPAHRQDRLSLRLTPRSKQTLERAAAYLDKTLTDFVVDVAVDKAEAVLREHEVIALSADEWKRFREMLLNPPEATDRLKRALAEHDRTVGR